MVIVHNLNNVCYIYIFKLLNCNKNYYKLFEKVFKIIYQSQYFYILLFNASKCYCYVDNVNISTHVNIKHIPNNIIDINFNAFKPFDNYYYDLCK